MNLTERRITIWFSGVWKNDNGACAEDSLSLEGTSGFYCGQSNQLKLMHLKLDSVP